MPLPSSFNLLYSSILNTCIYLVFFLPSTLYMIKNEMSMYVKTPKFMIKWTCGFDMTLDEKMIIL